MRNGVFVALCAQWFAFYLTSGVLGSPVGGSEGPKNLIYLYIILCYESMTV
jgi:hypothetical protein